MGVEMIRSLRLALLAITLGTGACAEPAPLPQPEALRRGISLQNWTVWRKPDPERFTRAQFDTIRAAGFDYVRILVAGMESFDAGGDVDPEWLKTLDIAIDNASAAGLSVIIDEHDFLYCAHHGQICRDGLPRFWRQVAEHYKDRPRSVLFEILNEPKGEMNPIWNDVVAETLAAIRRSNPTRTVVIGPNNSNDLDSLPNLKLPPDDRNILVTFHYYRPFEFSHQGAPWDKNLKDKTGVTWGGYFERDALGRHFDQVSAWARDNRRPILLGEFGAYDRSGTPIDQLRGYDAAVAREAERRGFAWCYWPFSGLNDFEANWQRDIRPLLPSLTPKR